MPKPNPFIERAPAIRAAAECAAIVRDLQDQTMLPTKQYNHASEARREKWRQLAQLAERMAEKTSEPAVKRVRRTLPTVAATGTPITSCEVAAATS